MLILARRENETVIIGTDIRVTVLGITRGQVRLGISAPHSVKVLREELVLRDAVEKPETQT